ncbi:hypothetical protein [Neobacillus jeddahensis]|uniref:hypothetical protein n=1 Tax=Neobacillus jeddahensis TaxID=1461580 RepID=UPI000590D7CB|nr:hypothetical protein [Neobacillus jeddahensis]
MINITELSKMNLPPQQGRKTETIQFVPGIWVNGKCLWLHNCTEKVIYDEELIFIVKQEQIHSKIRFSSLYVSNHSDQKKDINILAMHYFSNVGQDQLTFISPKDNHIFHHANNEILLVNGRSNKMGTKVCTVIPLWHAHTDQIWSSVDKGNLKYQPMAKGPAASIFAMKVSIAPRETGKMTTWTIAGSNKNDLLSMENALTKRFENR